MPMYNIYKCLLILIRLLLSIPNLGQVPQRQLGSCAPFSVPHRCGQAQVHINLFLNNLVEYIFGQAQVYIYCKFNMFIYFLAGKGIPVLVYHLVFCNRPSIPTYCWDCISWLFHLCFSCESLTSCLGDRQDGSHGRCSIPQVPNLSSAKHFSLIYQISTPSQDHL